MNPPMLLSMAVTLQATTTLVLAAPTAYVDFNAATNGTGDLGSPFNNFGDALSLVDNAGTVFFAPGTTAGAYRIGMAGEAQGFVYQDKTVPARFARDDPPEQLIPPAVNPQYWHCLPMNNSLLYRVVKLCRAE